MKKKIVIALGGNALLQRGDVLSAENQQRSIKVFAKMVAALAGDYQLVIVHGNGPQVGLLALQNAFYAHGPQFTLDVLGAQTQGMIGYLIEIELRNALERPQMMTTVLTLTEVDAADPAFAHPTKFVGPIYTDAEAAALAQVRGWTFGDDGGHARRVVASPRPQRVIQVDSTKKLLAAGHIVVASGGGGIPVARDADGHYAGVEAVVDKDASSAVLAAHVGADVFVLATDADAVMLDWGTPDARPLRRASVGELAGYEFAAGSMGPKVDAAADFVRRSGKRAVIGRIDDLPGLLAGDSGTSVVP